MATIKAFVKIDMRPNNPDWGTGLDSFVPTDGFANTSKLFVENYPLALELNGNYTFSSKGALTGGTIKKINFFSFTDGKIIEISRLHLDVSKIANDSVDLSDRGFLSGNDIITGSVFDDYLVGYGGNDDIYGKDGDDKLLGLNGNDYLDGGKGNDLMRGGDGDDTYRVNSADDLIIENSNQGIDRVLSSITYKLGSNVENLTLLGSANIDATGNGLKNIIKGNDGDNILNSGGNNDTLLGLRGNDILKGGGGNDYLNGNTGNDDINGGPGNDKLIGNLGADILNGGPGNDIMDGGGGNDFYIVNSSSDIVIELPDKGIDTVSANITYNLNNTDGPGPNGGNVENLVLTGTKDINGIGNKLNNTITGNDGNNILKGNNGNDILSGGSGDDKLIGGSGRDILNGGEGSDILIGGTSKDVFIFDNLDSIDIIKGFVTSIDQIHLEDAIFNALGGPGALNTDYFISGSGVTSAADADDYIIYDTDTGALYYDEDGLGGTDAIQFAVLDNGVFDLSADDFSII